jgi:hypothetical protein
VTPSAYRAFLDESSARREGGLQEYLVCAAVIASDACDDARRLLEPLRLPGQIKLHWTDESETRRRKIVEQIVKLGPMNVVVTHLDAQRNKTERFRRKCLEHLYYELVAMGVSELTLECRSDVQDARDRAHIVDLRGQGLASTLRIEHMRGGDEPLLWIADAVLGAVNAAHKGNPEHYEALKSTILLEMRTPDSRAPGHA